MPPEILTSLSSIEEPGRLADTVAAHMSLNLAEKQTVLEISDIRKRLEHVMNLIDAETDMLQIELSEFGQRKS